MATMQELLAKSLLELQKIQNRDKTTVIKGSELSETNLKRLVKNNFLQPVLRGWYIISNPSVMVGDTTMWYASYWNFISKFMASRYETQWILSAEQSLSVYTGSSIVPQQIVVRSPKASNKKTELIANNSIFNLQAELPETISTDNQYGLNLYSLTDAILVATPMMYKNDALTMRTALAMVTDIDTIIKALAETGQTTRAGRLIGAFRNIGRGEWADEIFNTMSRIGYNVREEDPFEDTQVVKISQSPYATRLRLMWQNMRDVVIEQFNRSKSTYTAQQFLEQMEAQYKLDAYHSLSIEGYRVTDELINRVKSGGWRPDADDKDAKNALAARGYWQSFQQVKSSVTDILVNGKDSAVIVRSDLGKWYQELFMPCVAAGIIKVSDIAGYRSNQVYIRNSMHTPLRPDALRDAMGTLFDLIAEEDNAVVRAVLGHFMFTFIHPYMDGNGRTGRFLMNVMFASGNYDWLIIPVERRDDYMSALEKASVEGDISPFVLFLNSI